MRMEGKKQTIQIGICDDLAQDRKRLYEYLTDYMEANDVRAVISSYQSGEELLKAEVPELDLAFLDIYMNDINGMETAMEMMRCNRTVQVIFTTISPDFAAEAFSIDAFHYLMKPLKRDDVYRQMNRFMDGIAAVRSIPVKIGRIEESIPLSDIRYIEANGKRTVFHMRKGKLEVSESMAVMKEKLADEHFISPIRWALVPLGQVALVTGTALKLTDGTEIPVSRSRRSEVKEEYAAYRWKIMRNTMRQRVHTRSDDISQLDSQL